MSDTKNDALDCQAHAGTIFTGPRLAPKRLSDRRTPGSSLSGAASARAGDAAARTMRLDYYHTGNATQELFSVDRVVIEPLRWPGNPKRRSIERTSGSTSSKCVTAPPARALLARVRLDLRRVGNDRRGQNAESHLPRIAALSRRRRSGPDRRAEARREECLSRNLDGRLDPKTCSSTVDALVAGAADRVEKNGDPADKVDLLILGDGYTAAERGKFEDARRLMEILFATSPFKERRRISTCGGWCRAAAESGISRPSTGIHRALAARRDLRYLRLRALRPDVREPGASRRRAVCPYEFIEILTNTRTYGGGGIFGLYSTVAADSDQAPYVFVHEFGHHFAGLADEYYTSPVAYAAGRRSASSRGSRT